MKIQKFEAEEGFTWVFWCPGCSQHHTFSTDRRARPVWEFSGDLERPTFTPSLLYPDKVPRCHLFLTAGRLQFLQDCGHRLAGQTVDLPEIPESERW